MGGFKCLSKSSCSNWSQEVIKERSIIKVSGHIICTVTISGLIYLTFHTALSFLASFIAGILIDVDHVFDYYLQEGLSLRIRKIYIWFCDKKYRFVFIFFHSLELLFLLWLIISIFKLGIPWVAFAAGLTQHIVIDILSNRELSTRSYLLSYRIIKGFKIKDLSR
ncbi:MAG: hypothetical protein PHT41_06990 [Candidatus Omnitrophica bacterium]|nr:hypothetical protein [Candidatus Omnitrophota bacterium]